MQIGSFVLLFRVLLDENLIQICLGKKLILPDARMLSVLDLRIFLTIGPIVISVGPNE